MTRIIILARYPTIRAGLRSVAASADDLVAVSDIDDPALLPALVDEHNPDAALIDLVDDPPETLDLIRDFARAGVLPPSLLLFASATDALAGLTVPGASLLLRDASAEEIQVALRSLAAGLATLDPRIIAEINEHLDFSDPEPPVESGGTLSPRELQVLGGIARGLPNKAIAVELGISEHTVKFHVGSIFQKLGVASRSEAVAVAARRGLFLV